MTTTGAALVAVAVLTAAAAAVPPGIPFYTVELGPVVVSTPDVGRTRGYSSAS